LTLLVHASSFPVCSNVNWQLRCFRNPSRLRFGIK